MKAQMGSRGKAPLIMYLGTKLWLVVNFAARRFCFREKKNPEYHSIRGWMRHRSGQGVLEKRKKKLLAPARFRNPDPRTVFSIFDYNTNKNNNNAKTKESYCG